MSTTERTLPPLATPTAPRRPRIHRRTLPNGLRAVAIAKNDTPIVEFRLRIPSAVTTDSLLAKSSLLTATMTAGTASRDRHELEQQLGLLGGDLNVGHDADKLTIGGSALSDRLADYLALVAEIVATASYPTGDVDRERARLGEQLQVANASAGTMAAKALAAKLYGTHRYARVLPEASDVAAAKAAGVRSLHRSRVLPSDAVVVLVGDIQPAKALDALERAFATWEGTAPAGPSPKNPFAGRADAAHALSVVNRPGSVQSAIRVGLPSVGRDDDEYAAARVANMLFGGYFSSRLVANLREDKGYTYTPRSAMSLQDEAAVLTINADVSTDVTAAAVNEIRYELGKIATTDVTAEELENARQYLIGGGLLGLSTQGGLASTAASLEYAGVGLEFLWEHQRALAKVSGDDVRAAAERLMNPTLGRYVVVGDAELIEPQLDSLGDTERVAVA
ncbi:insulinase family protein [Epidermidibacterium keratini]|uniref:Insulinase family protein n=1 Tax=Epidermidibacterium keratini TaxID=1891644 RepID=A0A7L4YRM0_9ACTN|nr:pitrilysin family protein [Epidermidibacterium keratini]QHC01603.1 insulinase family protein [Epidermidibacterium keratini]